MLTLLVLQGGGQFERPRPRSGPGDPPAHCQVSLPQAPFCAPVWLPAAELVWPEDTMPCSLLHATPSRWGWGHSFALSPCRPRARIRRSPFRCAGSTPGGWNHNPLRVRSRAYLLRDQRAVHIPPCAAARLPGYPRRRCPLQTTSQILYTLKDTTFSTHTHTRTTNADPLPAPPPQHEHTNTHNTPQAHPTPASFPAAKTHSGGPR